MGEGSAGYGKSVGTALRMVQQLHLDTMRLLTDFDGHMVEWRSVFGNNVTRDMSTSLPIGFWMAEGVYRYYFRSAEPATVQGITIVFEDYQKRNDEPLFLAAGIEYHVQQGQEVAAVCNPWDIWNLFFDKSEKQELGLARTYNDPFPQRVKRAGLIAVPLYSINSVEDAHGMLSKLGEQKGNL